MMYTSISYPAIYHSRIRIFQLIRCFDLSYFHLRTDNTFSILIDFDNIHLLIKHGKLLYYTGICHFKINGAGLHISLRCSFLYQCIAAQRNLVVLWMLPSEIQE